LVFPWLWTKKSADYAETVPPCQGRILAFWPLGAQKTKEKHGGFGRNAVD